MILREHNNGGGSIGSLSNKGGPNIWPFKRSVYFPQHLQPLDIARVLFLNSEVRALQGMCELAHPTTPLPWIVLPGSPALQMTFSTAMSPSDCTSVSRVPTMNLSLYPSYLNEYLVVYFIWSAQMFLSKSCLCWLSKQEKIWKAYEITKNC